WSNRKPVGTALACAGGFFICAQPARPARAAPATSGVNENFLIEKIESGSESASEFAFLRVNTVQQAMNKWCKQHRADADKRQPRKQRVTGREDFRGICPQQIDWTQSSKNHRGI